MRKILLTTSIALGALSSAAYAEPVVLTDAQMDKVAAGTYYTYRTDNPYDNKTYRDYQNSPVWYYDENTETFKKYGQTDFQWWRDYPEALGQIYFRYQTTGGTWRYAPYATYFEPEGGYGGPYTTANPPPTNGF